MNKFRTVVSLIIMVISAFAGFIVGAFLNDAVGGAILFAIISGIALLLTTHGNKLILIKQNSHGTFSFCSVGVLFIPKAAFCHY